MLGMARSLDQSAPMGSSWMWGVNSATSNQKIIGMLYN